MFQLPVVVECPVADHRSDTTLQNVVNRAKAFALLSYQTISVNIKRKQTKNCKQLNRFLRSKQFMKKKAEEIFQHFIHVMMLMFLLHAHAVKNKTKFDIFDYKWTYLIFDILFWMRCFFLITEIVDANDATLFPYVGQCQFYHFASSIRCYFQCINIDIFWFRFFICKYDELGNIYLWEKNCWP